ETVREWLTLSRTEEGTQAYFEKYVFGVRDFEEYLERIGGMRKLNYLKRVERLRESMWAPEEGRNG
ncbi:MAG: CoA transferase subunit A, partial [Anaerolineae bacterium]|nr:CoA transferase subunit A [Anaerolineae bacterium]